MREKPDADRGVGVQPTNQGLHVGLHRRLTSHAPSMRMRNGIPSISPSSGTPSSAVTRRLRRSVSTLVLIGAGLLAGACGPILSTQTINDADDAVRMARDIQADQYAVFEFVSAEEYLAKAREEWGYSDFQHALEYAERAVTFAQQAYERAMRNPQRGRPVINPIFADDLP